MEDEHKYPDLYDRLITQKHVTTTADRPQGTRKTRKTRRPVALLQSPQKPMAAPSPTPPVALPRPSQKPVVAPAHSLHMNFSSQALECEQAFMARAVPHDHGHKALWSDSGANRKERWKKYGWEEWALFTTRLGVRVRYKSQVCRTKYILQFPGYCIIGDMKQEKNGQWSFLLRGVASTLRSFNVYGTEYPDSCVQVTQGGVQWTQHMTYDRILRYHRIDWAAFQDNGGIWVTEEQLVKHYVPYRTYDARGGLMCPERKYEACGRKSSISPEGIWSYE